MFLARPMTRERQIVSGPEAAASVAPDCSAGGAGGDDRELEDATDAASVGSLTPGGETRVDSNVLRKPGITKQIFVRRVP